MTVIYTATILDMVRLSLTQEDVRPGFSWTKEKQPLDMAMSPPTLFKLALLYFGNPLLHITNFKFDT